MTRRCHHARLARVAGVAVALGLSAAMCATAAGQGGTTKPAPKPPAVPTYSSPIAMSTDGKLVWSVNPSDDSVSVIRTDQNKVVKKIKVGNEPQGVAVDPVNRYAYVVNAAGNSLTVIRITDARPGNFKAAKDNRFGSKGTFITGAEPWNVVASPDGKRVYVANSAQDTITVLDVATRKLVGDVNLRSSLCNADDKSRRFQPRGMAITGNSKKLYVTRFLSYVNLPGGQQATDTGRSGVVCRLNIQTGANGLGATVAQRIKLSPQITGFKVDSTGDGVPDDTSAFPNQLQSIVIRKNQAYLPNIAASPSGPLRFNVDTQAFVSVIDGVNANTQTDAGAAKFLNLNLGAQEPEPGKTKLFFSNLWAIAFAKQKAYAVAAGSDLLVRANVAGNGKLNLSVDANTTRYIDLNDPANPKTSGANAGKNPQGIVVNKAGTRAYVQNFVSRNVSVVNLSNEQVIKTIRTTKLPAPGSQEEVVLVGAEVFFSSRGKFSGPVNPTVNRLSSEGWQACSSCHFKGLTDGVVWSFGDGPRKSIPLNASFNPKNRNDQRVLNYTPVRDEVEDFDLNVRNVSGPGPLAAAIACANPPPPPAPPTSTLDPNHGLIISDTGNPGLAPCTINNFALPNANRQQVTVTLPGSSTAVPALTAMREWVKLAVRTPNAPLAKPKVKSGRSQSTINRGRQLFIDAGCAGCHGGTNWTISSRNFTPPPAANTIFTERTPAQVFGNPVGSQYLNAFLQNIGSFNLGVAGGNNPIGANVGGVEKASAVFNAAGVAQPQQDALGIDYNADGRGNGFNPPSLLGLNTVPPFYHNGACETLACVLSNARHRTSSPNGGPARPDVLANPADQAAVVAFLESIDVKTPPAP
jgi:YVTN family beta-propeller protein